MAWSFFIEEKYKQVKELRNIENGHASTLDVLVIFVVICRNLNKSMVEKCI